MAGYNYMNGGYYTNDPNKGSYGGIECSDHVCRPDIVDAKGRKRPIIAYTPSSIPESYIATSAERVVEHVHAPVVVTEYQYISQAKVDPMMKDCGVAADKWRRPSSPVRDRPQVVVTEYGGYGSPTKVEPMKILKEAVKLSPVVAATSPQPRHTAPASTVPKRNFVIASREAAWRYRNFNLASRPYQSEETYAGTIDSREAARNYAGVKMNNRSRFTSMNYRLSSLKCSLDWLNKFV